MGKIKLNIDGREVETEEGKTVLEAALEAGIYIPHICKHPDLPAAGACRLCLVEIEGIPGLPTSCSTPAADGMVVKTKSPQIDRVRGLAMELLLVPHPSECTSCPKYLNCELQSLKQYLGIGDVVRLRRRTNTSPPRTDNPLIVHDFCRCILCGRCVRACYDLRGAGVISYIGKGRDTRVGIPYDRLLMDAGCRFCGACVEVCPTGSLRDQEHLLKPGKSRRANLVPCKHTCPAGIDVPRYIRFVREKNYPAAVAVIREKVPFPAVLGYVCNHPCEAVCRRGEMNEAIAIRELKRYAAERDDGLWAKGSQKAPPTGKKAAVVGSGPAGLTAAYYLSKLGHSVTVFEALPVPGGMMRVGIPEYRLPTAVLDAEIQEIQKTGVEIKTNTKVESLEHLQQEGYQAILIAVGTHDGVKLRLPGAELDGVLVGISFLRDVRLGNSVRVGKKVLVLGGGNVAFDCARTALRLGATEVAVACLEGRDCMLSTPEEVAEGLDEGILLHNSQSFTKIIGENGKVRGVECLDVKSFSFDEDGNLNLETAEGSDHVLPADTVIFAVGQRPGIPEAFGLETGRGNVIVIDEYTQATGKEGVFAAGDAVIGTSSVIQAIASGRTMAAKIDEFLGGSGTIDEVLAPAEKPETWLGPGDGFACRKRPQKAVLPLAQRLGGFGSADEGYEDAAAQAESERCLQCDLRLKIATVKFWVDYANH